MISCSKPRLTCFGLLLLAQIFLAFSAFAANEILTKTSLIEKSANEFRHAISIFGELRYPKNFSHLSYVNPEAPKGGNVKFGVEGGFNSLNNFILKGLPAEGLGYLYDSLMEGSSDEIGTCYGLVAESARLSADKLHLEFKLRRIARFHDGKKITAQDVVFSFKKLISEGHPSYKMMFRDVKDVKIINEYQLRFDFKSNQNRDLPLLVASLPVLPAHFYEKNDFSKTSLIPPLGSGPYKIKELSPNRSIVYERVKDYWAKDLPINKGRYNFDQISYDYYRDNNVLIEAFKASKYDFRQENIARNWANAYNIAAVKNGEIVKKEIKHSLPAPTQAFILNLRRKKFQNLALRKAMDLAFDFEWLKRHIFYDSYKRTNSYFSNSEFAYPSGSSSEPVNNIRQNLIKAQEILKNAGYKINNFQLIDPSTNERVAIEFLIDQKTFEMVVAPFVKNLRKLGIDAKMRFVEENQYQTRVNNFDFDVITGMFGQAMIPGSELFSYFHSSQKNIKGSRNLGGIDHPKIDELVQKISTAKTKQELKNLCRKLDKILLENHYNILQWHNDSYRLLYRNIFKMPETKPLYSLALDSWWIASSQAN